MADNKYAGSDCPTHGTRMRTEPLTRADGEQIGNLTLDICDKCEAGVDDLAFDSFIDLL